MILQRTTSISYRFFSELKTFKAFFKSFSCVSTIRSPCKSKFSSYKFQADEQIQENYVSSKYPEVLHALHAIEKPISEIALRVEIKRICPVVSCRIDLKFLRNWVIFVLCKSYFGVFINT